jgi:hypothetical protein
MKENKKVFLKQLSEDQKRILSVLADMVIPQSQDGKMPSAVEIGFVNHLTNEDLQPWLFEGITSICEEAIKIYGEEFLVLGRDLQVQFIDRMRRKLFRFFNHLASYVVQFYYQNSRVFETIGMDARPPFPQGYMVEDGDLTLLGPVYERGKIYRE